MAVLALAMYVVMFLVVFVLRSVMQKRLTGDSGIRAGVLGASAWTVEWFAGWLLVLALIAGFAAPLADILGLDSVLTNRWVNLAGAVIAGVGIVLMFLAQVDMGTDWRIGIDENERTGLVDDGAFGLVRNPIFAAMILAGVGLALMVPNLISIVGAVTLLVAIELQVRFVEEPHLQRLHGHEYSEYTSHVGRFLPGIGQG